MSDPLLGIDFRPALVLTKANCGIAIESISIENGEEVKSVTIRLPWCDVAKVAYALLAAVEANQQKDAL